MLGALFALTVVRELTRLAIGPLIGLRAAVVEIGEGPALLRFRTGTIIWRLHQTAIVSATIWTPPPPGEQVRARLALLAAVRPAVTAAIVLAIHCLHVPALDGAHGTNLFLSCVRTVGEYLLIVALVPFSLRGASIIPFESDGLKLTRLLFPRGQRIDQDFARYYFAAPREALEDGDPARALALCREGIALYQS
jgi:hypothetical protein